MLGAILVYALAMRGRALLAAVLVVIAIRCVPGRLGIVDVGAVIPPMPLKTTPEGYVSDPPATSVSTPTATPTPLPTPTPTPELDSPEPLEPLPPVPDLSPIR
jgi:hypothetical protein